MRKEDEKMTDDNNIIPFPTVDAPEPITCEHNGITLYCYEVGYMFEKKEYGFEVFACSEEDARRKVRAMGRGKILGLVYDEDL